jgi:putative FmdB family regulatory protein
VPVYEYACTECGERLEVRQSFTDSALTVCPECSGRLRKVLSAVGVVFKGSGFYRNDSRAADATAKAGGGDSARADGNGAGTKEGAGNEGGGKAETPAMADAAPASGSSNGSGKDSKSSSKPPSTAKATAG